MEFRDFDVQDNEIVILLNQYEAEKYRKLLNLLFKDIFHKNGPIVVHRLASRPLMATTQVNVYCFILRVFYVFNAFW